MNKREDYEHLQRDLDENYYYSTNKDVNYIDYRTAPTIIIEFSKWFKQEELLYRETSLYYKGTALYFTYEDKKYYVSWTFYDRKLIKDAVKKLKEIGATNLQANYGELD